VERSYSGCEPLYIQGKKSKVEIEIETGRTPKLGFTYHLLGIQLLEMRDMALQQSQKEPYFTQNLYRYLTYTFEAREPKDILKYK